MSTGFADQAGQETNKAEGQADQQPQQGGVSAEQFETLSKRIDDSQAFIETLKGERQQDAARLAELEAEKERLQAELEKARKVEEVLARMDNQDQVQPTNDPVSIDPDKVAELVEQRLTQKEMQARADANVSQVMEAAKTKHGEDFVTKVKEAATAKGLSLDDVDLLAARSPAAAMELLGLQVKQQSSSSMESSVNTAAFNHVEPQSNDRLGVMGYSDTKKDIAEWNRIGAKIQNQ